jgi:hypothetical protein
LTEEDYFISKTMKIRLDNDVLPMCVRELTLCARTARELQESSAVSDVASFGGAKRDRLMDRMHTWMGK